MAFDLNIVSSKNIAKKAIEAVEQLDKALEQSILNDSSKAAKYAIVQENLKDVKNTLSSFSSVLKSIDETFNIKTLIDVPTTPLIKTSDFVHGDNNVERM